jgi:hypothetical protein
VTKHISVNVFADGSCTEGVHDRIETALAELKEMLVTTQEKLDGYSAAVDTFATEIGTAVNGIASDIAAIKAANPAADFTALDARMTALGTAIQSLKDLDAQHPPAPTP